MLWVGTFKQKKMKMLVSFFKKDLFHNQYSLYIIKVNCYNVLTYIYSKEQ